MITFSQYSALSVRNKISHGSKQRKKCKVLSLNLQFSETANRTKNGTTGSRIRFLPYEEKFDIQKDFLFPHHVMILTIAKNYL